jgi:hypothetical protein
MQHSILSTCGMRPDALLTQQVFYALQGKQPRQQHGSSTARSSWWQQQ